ncbi:TolC family protein [Adhaeribacter radiodurans]|uniref:TolC family protein n=1 Tax=Adhaeribacter radiodurans TaxID=2745197 RepID=A0A7L7LCJ3_9BACT|nr:TolC family protein [Adhaeribacter radiodurans]QMU30493.1 TolC family protein [Adhaeribacter radiodurans]
MKKQLFSLLFAGIFSWSAQTVTAQQAPQAFSLQQSIDYALANQPNLKNAQLQNEIAKARIGQIRSQGLPQINGAVDVGNNVVLQKTLIDPNMFGGGGKQQITITPDNLNSLNNGQNVVLDPQFVESTDPLPPTTLAFGLKYSGSAAISASQLLFDGSYLIGLKAAKVYTDLSQKQAQQTEIDVIDQVTKAYYGVLVSRERLNLLDRNLERLENQLREITEINRQGLAEKIDVDRLQVAYNNLKVEKDKATRLVELGVDLLKFQMGMDLSQPLELTDKLDNALVEAQIVANSNFDYSQRIEYSILETQRDLAKLNIKNKQSGYYPKLLLNGRYGYSGSSNSFRDLARFETQVAEKFYPNWFNFAFVGVSLQVPIFDGLRKKYEIQEAKLNLKTLDNGFRNLQQSIDLQLNQSNTNLQNALQVIKSQKESLELATEVARVTNIKFKEGVGSNLEVITAETELRQAQTNYYAAIYDALIAKVDLQKSAGTLHK